MLLEAANLAERFGAQVTLLNVLPSHLSSEAPVPTLGQRRIQRALAELPETVPFRHVSVIGDPATRIVEHARTERADLVLMPSRGRWRWGGLLTGSVTAGVMRHAHCPVWTVADHARQRVRYPKCSLCSVSRVEKRNSPEVASQLAGRFGARLSIVHSSVAFAGVPGACYFSDLSGARRGRAASHLSHVT
jgi:nucleotide-binding universal stress UspA family protein